jgi:tryptophan-rich sensory protein
MTAAPVQTRRWRTIAAAAAAASAVAILGGLMTDLGPWYYGLEKPSWSPPDWLFGPAWTLIFALTAASGVIGWNATTDLRRRARVLAAFAANGVFNILWSGLFFRLHRPDWALAEVFALWLSIVALIVLLAPVSRTAALLLAPYLVWVAFAGILNFAVVRLNAPFGAG